MSVVAELARSEHHRIQRAADDALHRVSMLEYEVKTLRGELDRLNKGGARQDRRLDAYEIGHTAGLFGVLHLSLAMLVLIGASTRPEVWPGAITAVPFFVAGAWMIVSSAWWSRPSR